MDVTDYKFAGTATNVDRDSKIAWTNPNNAKADDTSYSTLTGISNTYSDWLRLTNFGFSSSDIPAGATINGIEFVVCVSSSAGIPAEYDSALYLYDDGQVGNNMASATVYGVVQTERTYGGATDMCGTSLTQADIVASTFGVSLSSYIFKSDVVVSVDFIKIRVYYTAGGSSPIWLPFMKTRIIPSLGGF